MPTESYSLVTVYSHLSIKFDLRYSSTKENDGKKAELLDTKNVIATL